MSTSITSRAPGEDGARRFPRDLAAMAVSIVLVAAAFVLHPHARVAAIAMLLSGVLLALVLAALRIRRDARELAALRTHNEELGARARRAEELAHALHAEQQAFAARAGHELRNPLNGLCAAIEVLEAVAGRDPQCAEAVEVAGRQSKRLVDKVDELLPRTGGMGGARPPSR